MAQTVFQMQGVRHGVKHEKLQGIQQGTVLRSVSTILVVIDNKDLLGL